MSKLVEHAERELRIAGMYDEDAFYGPGTVAESVLKLVRAHAEEGHSGGSHNQVLSIFNRVIEFKNLAPLTNNPEEWDNTMGGDSSELWQNKRCSSAFSNDGGKTYWLLENRSQILQAQEYKA